MADYITTFGGTHFIPTDPNPDDIHITDIAHALSLICRGNGHVRTFFSVGQHCIFCAKEAAARGYSNRIILACLLHDACEAYMSDVPRPFKKHLAQYNEFEDHMLSIIYKKYLSTDLNEKEQAIVKEIDDDLLYFDLTYLLNEPVNGPAPQLKNTISYEVLPFESVEQQYLDLFHQYMR